MIGRLRGELVDIGATRALIDVAGVGYEVQIPETVAFALGAPGSSVTVWVRQVFREDGVSLYGFTELGQRRLFDLLTEVKGCGPRIAMAVIGQVGDELALQAIATQDAKTLARANGVGLKLAERIILELRDKVAEESLVRKVGGAAVSRPMPANEVVEALLSLGYRRNEAEAAAEDAGEDGTVEERVRLALRRLAR